MSDTKNLNSDQIILGSSTSDAYLMIPTCLDAIVVDGAHQRVLEPFAKFDRLPYAVVNSAGKTETKNYTQPYVSETVLSNPFQNHNGFLEPGVHLHWSMPDALTVARKWNREDEMTFPAVPNRWLVLRYRNGDSLEKKWMVLSDYLWPEGTDPEQVSTDQISRPYITYHQPAVNEALESIGKYPFRYMGRVESFETTYSPPSDFDKVEKLTALGYGEKMFAAFYPNCRGVFGIHDPNPGDLDHLHYEVYGWYANEHQEFLLPFIESLPAEQVTLGDEDNSTVWKKALEEAFGWTVSQTPDDQNPPSRLMCYAKVTLSESEDDQFNDEVKAAATNTKIAIGNSGSEALSAYLAEELSTGSFLEKQQIENQLESLVLRSQLPGSSADLGLLFEEARHNKTFRSVSGGRLWTIRPDTTMGTRDQQLGGAQAFSISGQYFLPQGLDEKLHEINILQKQFNKGNEGLRCLQRQIFADWHQYMRTSYHAPEENYLPNSIVPAFPEIDRAKAHIEQLMDILVLKKAFVGKINYDPAKHQTGESPWSAESLSDTSEITTLDSENWLHLVPDTSLEFISWVETWEPGAQSLAQWIAEKLNAIAATFHAYNAIIKEIRVQHQAVLNTNEDDYLALLGIAQGLDNWFGKDITTLVPPEMAAEENLSNIPVTEQAEKAKAFLLSFFKPLVELPILHLEPTSAPRYWQPTDPVLLLAGPALQSTTRHGMDNQNGHMLCHFLGSQHIEEVIDDILLQKLLSFSKFKVRENDAGWNTTSGNPWHPLFFEWEAVINPVNSKGNHSTDPPGYAQDFVTHHYQLEEKKAEYTTRQESGPSIATGDTYFSGRSVLTPYAEVSLMAEIEDYIIDLARHYRSLPDTETPASDDPQTLSEEDLSYKEEWIRYFNTNKRNIIEHFDDRHQLQTSQLEEDTTDASISIHNLSAIHTIVNAWDKLKNWSDNHFIQTQTLSGFNNALLMLHQALQLEIAEPNGFKEYTAFSNRVANAVGSQKSLSALSKGAFHPIRNGQLGLYRLRLVGTFGRVIDLIDRSSESSDSSSLISPKNMAASGNAVMLPPRISQPARLQFRWLSAKRHDLEVNSHPASSPISGWIMANNLDNSLMIYAADGTLLGYLDQKARWRTAPGKWSFPTPESIPNAALRKMVSWFILQAQRDDNGTEVYMSELLDKLESILAGIDPSNFAQHQARSLLMGRPIALVQATVDLELKGWPATNQSAYLFKRIVESDDIPYNINEFTKVKISIRIGEHYRLNDGVVGFWEDTEEGYLNDKLYTPLNQLTIEQTIAAPPRRLAILVDPRASVHCTTGILPTKALSIPHDHYAEALKKIQVTFLTAPVLSDARHVHLGLPNEAGFRWSWMEPIGDQWTELSQQLRLRRADVLSAFDNGEVIWNLLIDKGWISVLEDHPDMAYLRKKEERTFDKLVETDTDAETDRTEDIDRALHIIALGIVPALTDARFGPPSIIREGWLKVAPTENNEIL